MRKDLSMAKKQKYSQRLAEIISEIDTAAGMLIVTAMSGNKVVMDAMEKLTSASLELGDIAWDFECEGN